MGVIKKLITSLNDDNIFHHIDSDYWIVIEHRNAELVFTVGDNESNIGKVISVNYPAEWLDHLIKCISPLLGE